MAKPVESVENKTEETSKPTNDSIAEEKPAETAPKVGFTPRFKAGITAKPVEPTENKTEAAKRADESIAEEKPVETAPKVGFTPRFKMKPKVEEGIEETKPIEPEAEKSAEAKPAYKPRFIPPKPKE
jgi:hypothetical protein